MFYHILVMRKLFLFRLFHSLVFWFMLACLVYILYCGVTGTFNLFLLVALIAVLTEGVVLILNRWRCPLTALAEKLGAEKGSVTADMFLPAVVARNTFRVSTILFVAELALLSVRYFIE